MSHFNRNFSVIEKVSALRFEDYWHDLLDNCVIDLMKIDVEGHELEVLNGCGASLKSTKIIQFEFGVCNIDSRTFFRDFWKFFDAHGFILFCITPFGLRRVGSYRTIEESFETANYLGVNKRFINV